LPSLEPVPPGSDFAERLRVRVLDHFASQPARYDLDPASLAVEYVLNPGGFVNCSYRICDARRAYHLKVSASAEGQAALRQWFTVWPQLARYHAPPILEWIDLGSASGLLLPHLPGNPPAFGDDVVTAVMAVLRELYDDSLLAETLGRPRTLTAHEAYLQTFHDRFEADLRAVREAPPPSVGEELLRWMGAEADVLSRLIASSAAFDEPLAKPVHGDLWLNNMLWTDAADWYLLDWDDLRIGDPAADVAMLLGPTANDPQPLKRRDSAENVLTIAERERLPLLGRATLLDWVIDPLADWVDADAATAHASAVRREKERIHARALACYRELYG
jgi:hypothetical protein